MAPPFGGSGCTAGFGEIRRGRRAAATADRTTRDPGSPVSGCAARTYARSSAHSPDEVLQYADPPGSGRQSGTYAHSVCRRADRVDGMGCDVDCRNRSSPPLCPALRCCRGVRMTSSGTGEWRVSQVGQESDLALRGGRAGAFCAPGAAPRRCRRLRRLRPQPCGCQRRRIGRRADRTGRRGAPPFERRQNRFQRRGAGAARATHSRGRGRCCRAGPGGRACRCGGYWRGPGCHRSRTSCGRRCAGRGRGRQPSG
jgi:hypothetical protein